MTTTDLPARTTDAANASLSAIGSSTTGQASSLPDVTVFPRSDVVLGSFDIGSFEMLRGFVEQVVAQNQLARVGNGQGAPHLIDWSAVEGSVSEARSLELAIGRAVVLADQMSRDLPDVAQPAPPPPLGTEEHFFAFSVAGVAPDFGDESRYRAMVEKMVAKVLPHRRRMTAVPAIARRGTE
jgi:hypothetical protein